MPLSEVEALGHARLLVTPGTAAHQAPPMESEVTQSCPTLCDPVDCSPPGPSLHGIFPARVGCHFLLQEIFPTGIEPGSPTLWAGALPCEPPIHMMPLKTRIFFILLFSRSSEQQMIDSV